MVGRRPPYCDRVVDVMEELMKFALLTRSLTALTDRCSARDETTERLGAHVTMQAI